MQQLLLGAAGILPGLILATPYEGDWRLLQYEAPARWVETYYDFETMSIRQSQDVSEHALDGERLVDLFLPGAPEVNAFDLSIDGAGVLSGAFPGTTTAAYERLGLSSGGESLTLITPLNGDIGLAVERDVDTQSLYVAVRKPATAPTSAQLAGTWRLFIYSLPARMIETFMNLETEALRFGDDLDAQALPGEQLVDVNFSADPDRITGELVLDGSGTFSGVVESLEGSSLASGGWAVSGNDLTLTVAGDGGAEAFQLTGTANGELFVGISEDQDVRELVFLVKDGGTPTVAELAGPWRGAVFSAPLELVKTGPGLADVNASAAFEARPLSLHLSRSGVAEASGESGSYGIAGAGIGATFDDRTYFLLPTPSRDFMVGLFAETDGASTTRELELIVLTKESRLEVDVQETEVTIDWTGLVPVQLQRSTGLSGWSTEAIAPNSRTTLPVAPAEFFRVVTP